MTPRVVVVIYGCVALIFTRDCQSRWDPLSANALTAPAHLRTAYGRGREWYPIPLKGGGACHLH
jgi:hypothetical protein